MYAYSEDKEKLLARMRRIEGQAKGIQRMLEEDRYCVDLLQQLSALSAAADEVALMVLQRHVEGCVAQAMKEGRAEEHIKELVSVVRRAMRR